MGKKCQIINKCPHPLFGTSEYIQPITPIDYRSQKPNFKNQESITEYDLMMQAGLKTFKVNWDD